MLGLECGAQGLRYGLGNVQLRIWGPADFIGLLFTRVELPKFRLTFQHASLQKSPPCNYKLNFLKRGHRSAF